MLESEAAEPTMPGSTIQHIPGGGEPQESEPKRRIALHRWRQSLRAKPLIIVCALLSFTTLSNVSAQALNARISVTSVFPARIRIDLRLPAATNSLSFRNTYGGVLGLGERIETVEGVRDNGGQVRVQKLAPGEFQSTEKFTRFTYEVNLAELLRTADLSHVSSLNRDQGLLMLADLLPQSIRETTGQISTRISVDVPIGWRVASNARTEGSEFSTDDPETAVFFIAPSLHERQRRLANTNLSIILSGKWPFSDSDAAKIAGEILEEYSRVTKFELKHNAVVMLVPYPAETGPNNWSAETRGNVVVLLLGRRASGKRVLTRLGIVLSHELFHLWVPNSLGFEGDYDWFFEGFTLYQALRMDLRLGLISFSDYLETIARVYDSYLSSKDSDRLSLIEASERRWTTSASLVYEKGMLVAFIYDLLLRKLTNCQSSLDDVYTELFRLSATRQRSANETIMSVLSEREELKTFARDYVERPAKIDLNAMLTSYGIQLGTSGSGGTKFILLRDLSKTQRDVLRCVGYRK
ncbi:MAG: hypothetical protein ABJA18_08460 [bacterium]